jgi:hypothetical protein
MSKQINFEYNGKEYCLEYTRESIKQMEREGFRSSDVIEKPMSTLPKLFAGAFKAHHKFGTKQNEIDAMFDRFKNKDALFEKLAEMYNAPMEAMLDEPEEGNAIAWEASF